MQFNNIYFLNLMYDSGINDKHISGDPIKY